ncbi:MAG: lipid A biosynthesis acyltransferase, partial [Acidobacteria bacterium]|nr:lipid A biosynthesis acyltransferase [Acidobacteriota bacterium]
MRGLLGAASVMPMGFSIGAARVLDLVARRMRQSGEKNLRMALPEVDAVETIDAVYEGLGRMLYYFSRFGTRNRSNIGEWIEYEGFEHYVEAKSRGRGVLFATGHLGNWELSAFAHALMTEPMNVVVRPLDNPLLDELVKG